MRLHRLLVAATCLTACTADPSTSGDSRPIVNGDATTEYPTTGILLEQGSLICSGTLIGCD
ncbi:MAG TPA: hypothetical protein VFU21_22210, partial [Kofleriaceae bacterium]|nr:hypothetical protein [Kofleriaceae bacterium]